MSRWSDTPIGDAVARDLTRPLRRRRLIRRWRDVLLAADDRAYWDGLSVEAEMNALYEQRMTLLGDDRHAYCDRYLDEPVTGDWAGFVEDELARIDAEIAALAERPVAA